MAAVVDLVRIPAAEVIVRPAVYRMVKVVRPRIDGQLVQRRGIEPCPVEQIRLVERRISIARSTTARYRLTATPASRTYNGIGRTHSCAYGWIFWAVRRTAPADGR